MIFNKNKYTPLLTLLFLTTQVFPYAEMTLEEKVGQLLMVNVQAEEINHDARAIINDLHVGGIIYYPWANGLHSAKQVTKLSTELQNLAAQTRAKIPLIIAIDHEGGRVHWFKKDFTHFPSAFAYGMVDDPFLTEQCAAAMGSELRAAGITLALAPVTDIMNNPSNPIIGIRSFGSTPEKVITHAQAFINGLQTAGIKTCLKHFPGHGNTTTDSHTTLPIILTAKTVLEKNELAPFYALASTTDSIMTGHLLVPALDAQKCSTLSKPTLDLIKTLFNGVIITDSLVMQGIATNDADRVQAAIDAINAGCDIILVGGRVLVGTTQHETTLKDLKTIHATIVDAVKKGIITQARLDDAVSRIRTFKQQRPQSSFSAHNDLHAHQHLAYILAQKASAQLSIYQNSLPSTVYAKLKKELETIQELYHEKTNALFSR